MESSTLYSVTGPRSSSLPLVATAVSVESICTDKGKDSCFDSEIRANAAIRIDASSWPTISAGCGLGEFGKRAMSEESAAGESSLLKTRGRAWVEGRGATGAIGLADPSCGMDVCLPSCDHSCAPWVETAARAAVPASWLYRVRSSDTRWVAENASAGTAPGSGLVVSWL